MDVEDEEVIFGQIESCVKLCGRGIVLFCVLH